MEMTLRSDRVAVGERDLSRRGLLRRIGGAGVVAALGAALGLVRDAALAGPFATPTNDAVADGQRLPTTAGTTRETDPMTTERNKEIVRQMMEEGINGTNSAVLDEVIAPDAVDHTGPPGLVPGPEGIKQGLEGFRSAFPDAKATIEAMVAEGDMVSYRVTMRGTNTGPFMGMPATGKAFAAGSLTLVRIADTKVVEHWSYLDSGSMMRQLGLASR